MLFLNLYFSVNLASSYVIIYLGVIFVSTAANGGNMIKNLFSFKGSMDRKTFFKYSVIFVAIVVLARILFGPEIIDFIYSPFIVIGLVFAWIWVALFVKRGRALGIWWLWGALLALFLGLITWVAYLLIDNK
jgi:uncharacterized membrane protein YhaH (DUF805 family)